MANVFISHTGADIGWARQIHGWLSEDGHSVFLDVDQHDGVPVGVEWRRLLYERLTVGRRDGVCRLAGVLRVGVVCRRNRCRPCVGQLNCCRCASAPSRSTIGC